MTSSRDIFSLLDFLNKNAKVIQGLKNAPPEANTHIQSPATKAITFAPDTIAMKAIIADP